jgi:hypothetical protein
MGRRRTLAPLWLLPNLLSLDAPVVALVWQDFLARVTATPLRPPARIVLGLTVWVVYLVDRLLDVRRPAETVEASRHQFYRRHRSFAVALTAVALLADIGVSLAFLRPLILRNGFIVLGAVLFYLAAVHGVFRWRLPKELAVALLFTAGTFLVAWTWTPQPLETLLLPGVIFCLLCLVNLTAIESWEWHELRAAHGGRPPRLVTLVAPRLDVVLGLLAVACLAAGFRSPFYWAAGAAAALLWIIWRAGLRLPLDLRRVLVDAALLTPFFFRP